MVCNYIPSLNHTSSRPYSSLSGPCQFPTLGFVVSRYEQVKSFAPEQFWYIHIALTSDHPGEGEVVTDFHWKRNRIFEIEVAAALYGMVYENPEARVTSVKKKNTKKWFVLSPFHLFEQS